MYPDHVHFPVLPSPPPTVATPTTHTKEKERQQQQKTCPICVAHILIGAWFNSQWPAHERKLSASPPAPPPEAINCEKNYTSASLSQVLRVLFQGFLSRLLLLGVGIRVGAVTEASMSLLVCSQRNHFAVSRSTDHGLPNGLWPPRGLPQQYRPWTSTQPSAAKCARDTVIALGGSTGQGHRHSLQGNLGHGHQYGPLKQPGPWTSTWPQVAAQIISVHMALCGNSAPKHQHNPQLQQDLVLHCGPLPHHGPQTSTCFRILASQLGRGSLHLLG